MGEQVAEFKAPRLAWAFDDRPAQAATSQLKSRQASQVAASWLALAIEERGTVSTLFAHAIPGPGMLRKAIGFGFLAVAVFALARAAGWYVNRAPIVATQRSVRELVDQLDGHYYYDYQLVDANLETESLVDPSAAAQHWLSAPLGTDWMHDVFYITFSQFDGVPEDGGQHAPRGEIGDEQLVPLTGLASVKWWALSGTAITDAGVASLGASAPPERLWLGQTQLSDDGLVSLSQFSSLEHLSIESTPTTDRGLAAIAKLPRLKFLSLGSPYMTPDGLRLLGGISSLESLHMDRAPVDESVLQAFAKLKQLKTLSLRGTPTTDAALAHLGQLTQLETVHLDGTLLTDQGMPATSGWSNVRELTLSYTRISDAGIRHLAKCRSLRQIQLRQTQCSLGGILEVFHRDQQRTLVDALRLVFDTKSSADGQLVSVDLSPIVVVDADLADLSSLSQLQWLDISNNQLSDQGAQALADMGFEQLSLLKIGNSQVTDDGLKALITLPALRNLEIGSSPISDAALQFASQTRPALRITREAVVGGR